MYPIRGRLRNAVNCMRFFTSHANFNYARIILHDLPYSLPAQTPHTSQLRDSIVFLESRVLNQHWNRPKRLFSASLRRRYEDYSHLRVYPRRSCELREQH